MPPHDPTPERLARLTADVGLCRHCVHLKLLDSGRSVFVYCGLSETDGRFPRYPRLPVRACDGYGPAER
ncbi:MAG: hypothetical protein ACRD2Z_07390 [Thermoanaerobaculia bacterium]